MAELDLDPDQLAVEEFAAELRVRMMVAMKAVSTRTVVSTRPFSLTTGASPRRWTPRRFNNEIVCACGNVRWVKNADLFQVNQCKPCVQAGRRQRRLERARAKRKGGGW